MKRLQILFFLVLMSLQLPAQYREISGVVVDAHYSTPVPYAAVFVEHTQVGVVAGNLGEFTLHIPDSLSNKRLVSVGEGYRLTYISPENLVELPLRIALTPQENEKGLLSPSDGAARERGKAALLLDKAARFVMSDWIPLGNPQSNKFDFGRVQTLPTYNPIEGVRLRAGVASNARLNPHLFVRGYMAYGFKDQQLKYRGEAIWSLNRRVYHEDEFLKNNLRLVYEKDLFSPGEMHPRALNDLLLITYRRSLNEATYRNFAEISHEREHKNGLAHTLWLRRSRLVPQGELLFRRSNESRVDLFDELITSEAGLMFRYSFEEAYIQQKRKRIPVDTSSPVLFLSHSIGYTNLPEGEEAYHRTEFSAQKRFYLGSTGRLDAVGEFSKVWNAVPFPLLVYPNQRFRHHIENNAFFLNRALEFVADEQYTVRTTFVGDELLLSRIPLMAAFRAKELISLRATYGRLSDKNDPLLSSYPLFDIPERSFRYGSVPYVGGTVGLTNLLGLLRIEYVHRFTYRDHPDALLGRVRVDVTL